MGSDLRPLTPLICGMEELRVQAYLSTAAMLVKLAQLLEYCVSHRYSGRAWRQWGV